MQKRKPLKEKEQVLRNVVGIIHSRWFHDAEIALLYIL